MKASFVLKPGVSLEDGLKCLIRAYEKSERIDRDVHTNKHYELRNGRIWKKGDGTGKYWHLLVNSRIAHRQAFDMMTI